MVLMTLCFANLCCATDFNSSNETAAMATSPNADGTDPSGMGTALYNDTDTIDASNSSSSSSSQPESGSVAAKRDFGEKAKDFWRDVLIKFRDWLEDLITSIQSMISKMQ